MKLKTITVLSLLSVAANGATSTSLNNVQTVGGLLANPIVDNAGVPIAVADSSVQFGSFTDAFAATLGGLDTALDATVIAEFTPSGNALAFTFPGLFNGSTVTDNSGDLGSAASDNGAYALVTFTGGATPEVLVFSFGGPFPAQVGGDAVLGLGRIAEIGDVVFGGKELVDTNVSSLPAGLQAAASRGIPLNANAVIPEPSTGLLSLMAGLGLLARRRR